MEAKEDRTLDKSSWGNGPWQSEPDAGAAALGNQRPMNPTQYHHQIQLIADASKHALSIGDYVAAAELEETRKGLVDRWNAEFTTMPRIHSSEAAQ